MSSPALDPLAAVARDAARAAGAQLLRRFGAGATGVRTKTSRTDMVSDADREAEATIVAAIHAARPDDAILSEEGGGMDGAGSVRWIVDPLDGTTNFLWGIPHWSVSVAVSDAAGPAVGVVFDPCRDEMYCAVRGGGATLNGAPLVLDGAPPLPEALIGTGFNYSAEERARQGVRVAALLPQVRDIRRFGSAALDLSWLAAGRVDGYFETGLSPWDWAAGRLVVTEAGGLVAELPAPAAGAAPCVVAARAPLFDQLVSLLG